MPLDLAVLRKTNEARWANMSINPLRLAEIDKVASRLSNPEAQRRYRAVEEQTGVPADIVAVIHEREAGQRWNANIANGDPWDRTTTHVPKGRGPFISWEAAAIDALKNCPPYAARNTDWSPGGALTMLEQYNGLGYARRGIPSPYVWSYTDQYVKGKYIADGVFVADAVDKQIGVAALLSRMGTFVSHEPPDIEPTPTKTEPWWLVLIKFILSLFVRK